MRYGFLLLFYGWLHAGAQTPLGQADSIFLDTATQNAIARYEQISRDNEQLYNGIEYIGYDTRLKDHPFFESDSAQTGFIQYAGKTFSVPMRYDLVNEVLVLNHTSGFRIALHSYKIRSFSLLNHTYIWMADSSSSRQGLAAGFYDLLRTGPTQLLARRTKSVHVNPSANGGYGTFDLKTTYYLRKGNRYYLVKNKKMLLMVLDDRKKQLVAYIRKQKLRFRPNLEPAIVRLTQQYDELNKPL